MDVNPNPVVNIARICFSLENDSKVCLELFNSQGMRLDVIESRWFPAGEYRLDWDFSGLMPGVYLLRLTDGKNIGVNKIVKL
jgi:hypothetical protein